MPKIPPLIPNVVDPPLQITEGTEYADVGAEESVLTVTVVLTHNVVLQAPSALT